MDEVIAAFMPAISPIPTAQSRREPTTDDHRAAGPDPRSGAVIDRGAQPCPCRLSPRRSAGAGTSAVAAKGVARLGPTMMQSPCRSGRAARSRGAAQKYEDDSGETTAVKPLLQKGAQKLLSQYDSRPLVYPPRQGGPDEHRIARDNQNTGHSAPSLNRRLRHGRQQ